MKTTFIIRFPLIAAAVLGLYAAQANTVSKADYEAGKTRIKAEYQVNEEHCASLAGNARAVCAEEAKATERVARTELDYDYSGTRSDHRKALVAKAETRYAVAKERCGDRSGTARDVCIQEAKADQSKALADIKMGKEITDAKADAAAAGRDADFKVATEKCDVLSGDAKDSCVAAARAKYGKS